MMSQGLRLWERLHTNDQQKLIYIQVAVRSTCKKRQQYSIDGSMVDLSSYSTTSGERNFLQQIKDPVFLEAVLAIEIMKEPQSDLKEKVNPSILKDYFSTRTDPSIFISIAPVLLDQSNETIWVFPALKSKNHFLPHSTVCCRSDSSSEDVSI